ncbi:MAG: T9SS type A sorting domain-containing protein, partial [Ignavibacteria bacterium]|nr:T9SS type A sorting domain-containing protein [Ignavibacteria bacterium]
GITFKQIGIDLTPTSSMVSQSVEFSGATSTTKFKISAKVTASNRFYLDNISVISGGVTAIENTSSEPSIPNGFTLSQNYPNPFNPSTTISFSLPARLDIQLNVFNQLGEKIASLVNETFEAGTYSVVWNGALQPSGIYFCELRVGSNSITKKLILLK